MLTNENDISTQLFDELTKLKVNLIKETLEVVGENLGKTGNKATYKNFTYKDPIHLDGISLEKKFIVNPAILPSESGSYSNYESREIIPIEKLEKIFPKANKTYLGKCIDALTEYAPILGLTTKGMLMILGQLAHESGQFLHTKEIKGETTKHGQPTGPYMKRYYGRGPIQVTHMENYKKIYEEAFPRMGISANIYQNPELCEENLDIGIAASIGWLMVCCPRSIQAANAGDIVKLTKYINGGDTGLKERTMYTNAIFAEMYNA